MKKTRSKGHPDWASRRGCGFPGGGKLSQSRENSGLSLKLLLGFWESGAGTGGGGKALQLSKTKI